MYCSSSHALRCSTDSRARTILDKIPKMYCVIPDQNIRSCHLRHRLQRHNSVVRLMVNALPGPYCGPWDWVCRRALIHVEDNTRCRRRVCAREGNQRASRGNASAGTGDLNLEAGRVDLRSRVRVCFTVSAVSSDGPDDAVTSM